MLANPDIHVVSICSYPYQTQSATPRRRAGKHIIIEKLLLPFAAGPAEMEAALKKAKVKTCVCLGMPIFQSIPRHQSRARSGACSARCIAGEVDYYHGIGPWYGQFR